MVLEPIYKAPPVIPAAAMEGVLTATVRDIIDMSNFRKLDSRY